MKSVDNNGSRPNDREPSMLNFAPILSKNYDPVFYEQAYAIAFLPLDLQTNRLNIAIKKARMLQEQSKNPEYRKVYIELAHYIAALLLLRDLLQIGWRMTISGTKIQLYQQKTGYDISTTKQQIRDSMQFERRESLQTKSVKDFIRYMERTRIVDDHPRNILSLVADGPKLHSILESAAGRDSGDRIAFLQRRIKPFLQIIDGETSDKFTGYRLADIWRYFRLKWSIPYRSIPGRNIFYLIRDAGQPCHPVMGIAALANCVIGLKCRDDRIGWTPDALAERLREAMDEGVASYKKAAWEIADLLNQHLEKGIAAISIKDITTRNAVAYPTPETIEEIGAIAQSAAGERYEHLQQEARLEDSSDLELINPVESSRLPSERYDRDSSKALFRRKRAAKLARLLEAKLLLQNLNVLNNAPAGLPFLLWNDSDWKLPYDRGRSALRTILNAHKESRIGTSMMEIVVCGAVQPYNHILGGKLVAMMLTSPEIVRDYEQRYSNRASTIASQIADHEVTRPAHLVYLGTSSLYVGISDKMKYSMSEKGRFNPSSSSQYNRIQIPAEIAKGTGEIRYECIGLTEGFGVVHFSAETRQALEELDILLHSAKRVNSIFGEGTSPRMRKIRQGISLLGLDDRFLVHGQFRLVYGINLAHNTEHYLTGRDENANYILPQKKPKETTGKIARYWIKRWLASRVDHEPALEAVAAFTVKQVAVSREFQDEEQSISHQLDL